MNMKLDKESMRARYWELTDAIAAVKEESAELYKIREEYKEACDEARTRLRTVNAQITEIEEPRIPEMQQELAIIARALGQKLGARPKAEADPS
jgi:uncharacterized coiled-coil DUF342 family protein